MNSPLLLVAAILLGLLILAFVTIKIFDTFLQKHPPKKQECHGCSQNDCGSCRTLVEIQPLPSPQEQNPEQNAS